MCVVIDILHQPAQMWRDPAQIEALWCLPSLRYGLDKRRTVRSSSVRDAARTHQLNSYYPVRGRGQNRNVKSGQGVIEHAELESTRRDLGRSSMRERDRNIAD